MIKEHYNQKWVHLLKARAVTIGQHIFYERSGNHISTALRNHEMEHTRQYEKCGLIGFLVIYLYWYLVGRLKGLSHWEAYEKIPFEVEAREAERRT